LSELHSSELPPRPQILRAIARDLHSWVPGFRPVAEGLLAEESRIDLFGIAGDGAAVIVSVSEGDQTLARLARLLAQRRWLGPRLADWLKLSPGLGIRPEHPIQAVLAASDFGVEARAAARSLEADWLRLVRYRGVRNGVGVDLLLESVDRDTPERPGSAETPRDGEPLPTATQPFRTGLRDEDLGLSDGERAEFE
jgi:hypothetical protein